MPMIQSIFQPMMEVDRVDADPDGGRFRLKAHGGSFFTRMLGLAPKATITVDETGFRLEKTKFGSEETTFIPMSKIASTVYMVMKPIEFLGFAFSCVVFGLPFFAARDVPVVVPLGLLGLALIFVLVFFFGKKRTIVGAVSAGSTVESVKLKAKAANIEDIREGMRILEELLMDTASAPPPSRSSEYSDAPVAAVEEKVVTYCPHCEAKMSLPASGIGRRVRCLSCREVFTAEVG